MFGIVRDISEADRQGLWVGFDEWGKKEGARSQI